MGYRSRNRAPSLEKRAPAHHGRSVAGTLARQPSANWGETVLGRMRRSGVGRLAPLIVVAWLVPALMAGSGVAAAAPTLAISPAAGLPGDVLGVRGDGFPTKAAGHLVWADGTVMASFVVNRRGAFAAGLTVPPIPAGNYVVAATAGGAAAATVVIVLAPGAAPTPTAPTATATAPPVPTEPLPTATAAVTQDPTAESPTATATPSSFANPTASAAPTPNGPPIALGVFVPGAPGDPARLDAFAAEIGRMPAIVPWYQAWGSKRGSTTAAFNPALLATVASRGAVPLITWEPWDPTKGANRPAYQLANIARGDFDAYVDSWATGLAAYGGPVYLRFAHEMNATWYPWCAGVNANTSADYVAAWRHLRDRFAIAGATNVRWVWSPDVAQDGATPLAALYPGNDAVDWVALDGYNWGTSQTWSAWRDFSATFGPSLATLQNLTGGSKPVMIAETASSELGGDKANWINDAFWWALPVSYPQVRAVVWFNEATTADWPVETSPAALAAFRAAVNAPYLQGALP